MEAGGTDGRNLESSGGEGVDCAHLIMSILQSLSQCAAEKGLKFLVIGGQAVIWHGYSRTTRDLDLMIPRTQQGGWRTAIETLGYRLLHETPVFMQFEAPSPGQWPVDFTFVSDETFGKLWVEASDVSLMGARVRMPSVMHLIALKLHSIKQALPHREAHDLNDVIELVDANHIDTAADSFRQLCEKYANLKAYEIIARATRKRD